MSTKSELVIHGFLNLSSNEQKEVLDKIREYERSSEETKKSIKSSDDATFSRINLGPIGTACSCCGR
jgi:hypothetical protein